jgi:phage terminase small subunit
VPDVVVADMDRLTGPERKLIASVKKTKDGIEVKMRNQDEALSYLAKHLGMLVEKRELTGKDGKPLLPAPLPVELPSDPKLLAALYAQVTGG